MANNIYNIPLSCSLVDVLAGKVLSEYKDTPLSLPDILILLPSRRACRDLQDAFVRMSGTSATLLPLIKPIGEADEDDIFFSGDFKSIPPSINPIERLFIFIRLMSAYPKDFELESISYAQACFLAKELASLVDAVNNEELSFSSLHNIVPEEYASHWQKTIKFLKIVSEWLPRILEERSSIDSPQRKNLLLYKQAEIWQKNPPLKKVIIAGSTAPLPAMKELFKTVINMPLGEVYLSGVDKYIQDDEWDRVDEQHPQYELKKLLEFLELSRFDVTDAVPPQNPQKELFAAQLMLPAICSDRWRNIKEKFTDNGFINGLKIINCPESRFESLSIALIMRHTLETSGKTAALVTTDRTLARRTANELKRWGITVDDSAGFPLSQTPVGIFLRLVAKACEKELSNKPLLSLLKHPLCSCSQKRAAVLQAVREYEKLFLRKKLTNNKTLEDFVIAQKEKFSNFSAFYTKEEAKFSDMLKEHILLAENLAANELEAGDKLLWKGEDGELAAQTLADIIEYSETIGLIKPDQYLELFEALFSGITVRPKYGSHPRLKILGPIEARLGNFDTLIVGNMNEGSMPTLSSNGAWLSRPMKKDFGLPLPEKNIGILAHDFCRFISSKEVYLTRSNRSNGTPTVKSRWLMRLETLLGAFGVDVPYDYFYLNLAQKIDNSNALLPLTVPEPKPAIALRPRKLSATSIEQLMHDPYIIFAKFILKLKPLDEIDIEPSAMDFGSIIHKAIEVFNLKHPQSIPLNAKDILFEIGLELFDEQNFPKSTKVFWLARWKKISSWFIDVEKKHRQNIKKIHNEISGEYTFNAPAGNFTINAKADRIDETKDGKLVIIDYKTGAAPSKKSVTAGYAPQLPIEGIIAQNAGYPNIFYKQIEKLCYWRLSKEVVEIDEAVNDTLENSLQTIKELIASFDFVDTPYKPKPQHQYSPKCTDYVHLSRIKEWGIIDKDDE